MSLDVPFNSDGQAINIVTTGFFIPPPNVQFTYDQGPGGGDYYYAITYVYQYNGIQYESPPQYYTANAPFFFAPIITRNDTLPIVSWNIYRNLDGGNRNVPPYYRVVALPAATTSYRDNLDPAPGPVFVASTGFVPQASNNANAIGLSIVGPVVAPRAPIAPGTVTGLSRLLEKPVSTIFPYATITVVGSYTSTNPVIIGLYVYGRNTNSGNFLFTGISSTISLPLTQADTASYAISPTAPYTTTLAGTGTTTITEILPVFYSVSNNSGLVPGGGATVVNISATGCLVCN